MPDRTGFEGLRLPQRTPFLTDVSPGNTQTQQPRQSGSSGSNAPILENKKQRCFYLNAPVYAQSHLVLCIRAVVRVAVVFNHTGECRAGQTYSGHTPRTQSTRKQSAGRAMSSVLLKPVYKFVCSTISSYVTHNPGGNVLCACSTYSSFRCTCRVLPVVAGDFSTQWVKFVASCSRACSLFPCWISCSNENVQFVSTPRTCGL